LVQTQSFVGRSSKNLTLRMCAELGIDLTGRNLVNGGITTIIRYGINFFHDAY